MGSLKRVICLLMVSCVLIGTLGISAHAAEIDTQNTQTEGYDEIPLYFQTDYPDTPYGNGTVATSGCSITCLAMVASYLTGQEYLPDTLANRFGGAAESNIHRLEAASNALDIPAFSKTYDWRDALSALAEGKIVIALMNSSSTFTDSQHFIVLTGLTDDGKVLVNDPYEPNYSRDALKDGCENGFSQETVCTGFCGGWIYEKELKETDVSDLVASIETTSQEQKVSTPVLKTYESVPLYYQNDYSDTRYGSGTIASCGCGITSVAMVASYLTNHEYLPDMLADYVADYNGTSHIQYMEYVSDLLQLPWERAENAHVALKALQEGKIVIALMGSNSLFTTGQHFIVLTGINEEGKIMVNDSNKSNYSLWNLKNAFVNGFSEGDIILGYQGAWIYDPDAMPDEPYIYEKEEVYVEPRYPGVELTDAEKNLLARMIWVEARGESFEGQQAIAEIVLNRLSADNFPNTIKGVIYQADQFNSTPYLDDAEPTHIQYEAIERALTGPYVLDEGVVFFGRSAQNDNVWGWIGGHVFCYQWDYEDPAEDAVD